jgi:pimeloyl-ACP methyl ester carboxylesterase
VVPEGGDPLATIIVGHSMGGAVAVWAAARSRGARKALHPPGEGSGAGRGGEGGSEPAGGGGIPSLGGCVVVDVVEGTAMGEGAGCCGDRGQEVELEGGQLDMCVGYGALG